MEVGVQKKFTDVCLHRQCDLSTANAVLSALSECVFRLSVDANLLLVEHTASKS